MTAKLPILFGVRVATTLLVLFLSGMGFLSLVFGTEPARRVNPTLWTPLTFALPVLGLAYAWGIWKVRTWALWLIFGCLVLIVGLLWRFGLSMTR